jgi:hypothetical protein
MSPRPAAEPGRRRRHHYPAAGQPCLSRRRGSRPCPRLPRSAAGAREKRRSVTTSKAAMRGSSPASTRTLSSYPSRPSDCWGRTRQGELPRPDRGRRARTARGLEAMGARRLRAQRPVSPPKVSPALDRLSRRSSRLAALAAGGDARRRARPRRRTDGSRPRPRRARLQSQPASRPVRAHRAAGLGDRQRERAERTLPYAPRSACSPTSRSPPTRSASNEPLPHQPADDGADAAPRRTRCCWRRTCPPTPS